jgi:hypothetical protein
LLADQIFVITSQTPEPINRDEAVGSVPKDIPGQARPAAAIEPNYSLIVEVHVAARPQKPHRTAIMLVFIGNTWPDSHTTFRV